MPNEIRSFRPAIVTQGTTGAASRISITPVDANGNTMPNPTFVTDAGVRTKATTKARVQLCTTGTGTASTNGTFAAVTASGFGSSLFQTISAGVDLVLQSSLRAQATGTLTVTTAGLHLETITIGPRVYVIDALGTLVPDAGEVTVDISANVTAASGTLTIAEPVTAGDTMTIGNVNYVYVAQGTANSAGEIDLGGSEAQTKLNIVKAILGTDGVNTAHPDVTCAAAFSTDALTITAKIGGTGGNSLVTLETFTHVSNVFGAGALASGANPTAAQGATAIRTAINGDSGAVVTAGGSSGTVAVTAIEYGSAMNAYATTETTAGSAWGAATLTGGADDDSRIFLDITNATAAEGMTLRVGNPPTGGPPLDCSMSLAVVHAAP